MYRLSCTLILIFVFSCINKEKNERFYLEKAFKNIKAGDYKSAYINSDKAIQINDDNYLSFFYRGRALYELDSLNAARRDLLVSSQKNKSYTATLYYLGLVHYDLDDYRGALKFLNKAVETKGSDSVYFEISDKFSNILLEEKVSMAEIVFFRGASSFYLGNFKNAETDFRFAMSENYNIARVYYFLGLIELYYRNNKIKACEYLNISLKYGYKIANDSILENCK